jgi:hypothetical protein
MVVSLLPLWGNGGQNAYRSKRKKKKGVDVDFFEFWVWRFFEIFSFLLTYLLF